MTLASYTATGFAVAGIHALLLLIEPANAFHRRALTIALLLGAPAAVLQPVSGDISARSVARYQPAKLAAMEAHFETASAVPLLVGGWPSMDTRETRYAIKIPYGLSLLAFHDPNAVVKGLNEFPRQDWPNVPIVHTAFQIMVALGSYLALVSLWAGWMAFRRRDPASSRPLLWALTAYCVRQTRSRRCLGWWCLSCCSPSCTASSA
jgi:cytochrome d ubiquinol oxidase subunit I